MSAAKILFTEPPEKKKFGYSCRELSFRHFIEHYFPIRLLTCVNIYGFHELLPVILVSVMSVYMGAHSVEDVLAV
nr:hypothetical protein Iba_chr06bCG8290 [Ipomoea batatas]GMD10562.1 hypothetical protein Iba_chr06eCG7440 [Ipomoea batatas]